jgi:hypothetical protein
MKSIFYPGNDGQACRAEYGIFLDHDAPIARANIVVVNPDRTGPSTTLWTADKGRDIVLNKVLAGELKGVRVDCVRFFAMLDLGQSDCVTGIELPIRVDAHDFIKRGNPHEVRSVALPSRAGWMLHLIGLGQPAVSFRSRHIVCGCATFYTDFQERRHLAAQESRALCAAVGYHSVEPSVACPV